MKFKVILFSLAALCYSADASAELIQTDPALAAAILEQARVYKKTWEERMKKEDGIMGFQAMIKGSLENIHRVEEKTLEYLSNASSVLKNMYQIKTIGELVAVDIPNNLIALSKEIPHNLKGTAITLIVNRTVTETIADITSLSATVQKLVTSHYSFKDNENDDKNINLLSSAERYYILYDVLDRLNKINRRISVTRYCMKYYSWLDLWRALDRESYVNLMWAAMNTRTLINDWNRLIEH